MKGNKTRKIIALMLLIAIITATSNVFVNRVFAAEKLTSSAETDKGDAYEFKFDFEIVDSKYENIELSEHKSISKNSN